jgi:hypothetical protein
MDTFIAKHQQATAWNWRQGPGLAFVVAELDQNGSAVQLFDNRAYLPAHKAVLRPIIEQGDDIQKDRLCRHWRLTVLQSPAIPRPNRV